MDVQPLVTRSRLRAANGCEGGFTLIELLVVVAIIALLVAILLPAVGKARDKAKETVCAINMRTLSMAMQTYLASFDNAVPVNGIVFPKSGVPKMYQGQARFTTQEAQNVNTWRPEYGALWSYMNGEPLPQNEVYPLQPAATAVPTAPPASRVLKAYLCPSDAPDFVRTYKEPLTLQPAGQNLVLMSTGVGPHGYWSYSVNSVLNSLGRFRDRFQKSTSAPLPWADPLKFTNVQNAANFLVFVEEGNDSLFNDEVFDAPAFGGGDHLTNRHNNGGNVAFGDAHVERFSEVQFDNGGNIEGYIDPQTAMKAPVTRYFFPDGGEFAAYALPPAVQP